MTEEVSRKTDVERLLAAVVLITSVCNLAVDVFVK